MKLCFTSREDGQTDQGPFLESRLTIFRLEDQNRRGEVKNRKRTGRTQWSGQLPSLLLLDTRPSPFRNRTWNSFSSYRHVPVTIMAQRIPVPRTMVTSLAHLETAYTPKTKTVDFEVQRINAAFGGVWIVIPALHERAVRWAHLCIVSSVRYHAVTGGLESWRSIGADRWRSKRSAVARVMDPSTREDMHGATSSWYLLWTLQRERMRHASGIVIRR